MAFRTDGDPRIEFKDVTITRWPPGERKYGVGTGLKSKDAESPKATADDPEDENAS